MPQPLVTIAIPTYNRLGYLRQAIHSALEQTYPAIEVIVSDNCSSDGTAEAVEAMSDPRLVLLRQSTNLGMLGNWNACLEHARSEFFLLLSDDDFLEQGAIDKLVRAILDSPAPETVGVSYCRTWEVDSDGERRRVDPISPVLEDARGFALEYFRRRRRIFPSGTLLRTEDVRSVGGYKQGSVILAVDCMVWSRILLKRGAIAGVPEPLASYRIHNDRTTSASKIETWRGDIAALIELWAGVFDGAARQQFQRAARDYESWVLAAIINQAAGSWRQQLRALGEYWECRRAFAGLVGLRNCLGGLAKLLAPEALKRPVRSLILARTSKQSLQATGELTI